MTTFFDDVRAFCEKLEFISQLPQPPAPLPTDVLFLRIGHMLEELAEFAKSQGADGLAEDIETVSKSAMAMVTLTANHMTRPPLSGLADGGDALIDLAWLALGTGGLMHLPMNEMWAEVARANMLKERGPVEKRAGHGLDAVKPPGWKGPDHWPLIFKALVDRAPRFIEPAPEPPTRDEPATFTKTFDKFLSPPRTMCYCGAILGEHVRGSAGCRFNE